MKQLIIGAILTIVVVIFAVQNADPVAVNFVSMQLKMSLALLLIVTLVIGMLAGLLFTAPKLMRNRKEINQLKKNINGKDVYSSTSINKL